MKGYNPKTICYTRSTFAMLKDLQNGEKRPWIFAITREEESRSVVVFFTWHLDELLEKMDELAVFDNKYTYLWNCC